MILHALAVQCSTRVSWILELSLSPRALILLAAIGAVSASGPEFLGLETTVHLDLLQCSISDELPLPLPYAPTAQALCVEMAATPFKTLQLVPTLGLATWLHAPREPAVCVCCVALAAAAPGHPAWK